MPFVVRLAEHGVTLATRPLAAEIRVAAVEQAGAQMPIDLDFASVMSVSYSFADELVGRLCQEVSNPTQIRVLNADDEVERVLEKAIDRRLAESVVSA